MNPLSLTLGKDPANTMSRDNGVRRPWTKAIALLFAVAIVVAAAAFTRPAWAEDTSLAAGSIRASEGVHYIAVASDRHNDEEAIGIAMTGMPASVEYVCLNGDMSSFAKSSSNAGGQSSSSRAQQAYNTSTVLAEVQQLFPRLTSSNVSIVYASHDANATDDAGIMKCADPEKLASSGGSDSPEISQGMSGLLFTGYDGDKPAYYIYGVSYYDMTNPNDVVTDSELEKGGKESAEEFKEFADQHPGVPLIVIGHVPIHALRGDNLAASYWNEALNYAATGSANSTSVTREVAYLHGHNHTVESTEYNVAPGGTIDVQGTVKGESAQSKVFYTYITAGYLKDNHTSTLVAVEGGHLSFAKNKGCVVEFETNGDSEIARSTVTAGGKVEKPATPTRKGYVFTGWYKEAACENAWNFNDDAVTEDMTLYAGWVKGAKPGSTALRTKVRASKKQAVLSWAKASNADDYRIAYRKAGAKKWVRKWSNGNTSYTVDGLAKKGLYDFMVTASSESGDRMIYGASSSIKHRYISALSGVKAKALTKTVKVSWKKDAKATSYQVRYSTSKNMKNAQIVSVSSSKSLYKIRNPKKSAKYYVRVRPVVNKGGTAYYGAYSAKVTAKTKK